MLNTNSLLSTTFFQKVITKSQHSTRDIKYLRTHYLVYTLTSIWTLYYFTTLYSELSTDSLLIQYQFLNADVEYL